MTRRAKGLSFALAGLFLFVGAWLGSIGRFEPLVDYELDGFRFLGPPGMVTAPWGGRQTPARYPRGLDLQGSVGEFVLAPMAEWTSQEVRGGTVQVHRSRNVAPGGGFGLGIVFDHSLVLKPGPGDRGLSIRFRLHAGWILSPQVLRTERLVERMVESVAWELERR